MTVSVIKRKICAIVLIAALTLPVVGFAAEPDEAGAEGTPAAGELQTEASVNDDADIDEAEEVLVQEAQSENAEAIQTEAVSEQAMKAAAEPEVIQKIVLNVAGEDGKITAVWKAVESAQYYMVYLDNDSQGVKIDMSAEGAECRYTSPAVDSSKEHSISIEAYGTRTQVTEGEPQPEPELIAEGSMYGITAISRSALKDNTRKASRLGINLKTLLGESRSGYSVVQGGCTDGTYAYYLMVSAYTQNGRILKTRISDNAIIGRSDVITDMEHGNGMTMDTTRNRLIISGRNGWKNRITAVDAGSLRTIRYYTLDYSQEGKWTSSKSKGIASIAYVKKYDCFIAVQRDSHELLVMDANVDESTGKCRVIGMIGTVITSKYPGTYQAMDADDRYVYLLLSYYNSSQPYNKILVLDWNCENLGVNTYWKCNNNKSGKPDAAIRLSSPYEAENIYHIDRGDGTSEFYLSEYYNHPKTKYVYKKKKVKVKWKKVKKKVKVKWKKVNGKWKYKKKWKKVWKYKKKWKTVKVKSGTYLNREGYVYALGQF